MDSNLFTLLQSYSSLVPPAKIFPLLFPKLPSEVIQQFLIDSIICNSHLQAFPPSASYQRQFWKKTIAHLESTEAGDDSEINPIILEHYLAILASTTTSQLPSQQDGPSNSFVTHFWYPADDITTYRTATLLESRTTLAENGSTGFRTWRSSFVLAEFLRQHPDVIQRKPIMELGAGIGFLGIIVASLQKLADGCSSIWITDLNDDVLARCRSNLLLPCNLSSSHPDLHFRTLDWSSALDRENVGLSALLDEIKPEVILGADLVYDPELVDPLVAILHFVLVRSPRFALLATTIRNESTFDKFLDAAQRKKLIVKILPTLETSFLDTAEAGIDADNDIRMLRVAST
ncbi:putative methyltransferase-domain-containing protein [Mycena floridula]|nr:putative methyltransferase-domain-containing protein [Mycena floridula]